jgi:hypothetical protein
LRVRYDVFVAALLASCALPACSSSPETSSSTSGGEVEHDAGSYPGACAVDADCADAACVALTPGGPKVCGQTSASIAPMGAMMCHDPDAGVMGVDAGANCSSTSDCVCGSACYDTGVVHCYQGSLNNPYTPACLVDACSSDADCEAQPGATAGTVICAPAGVYGRPVRTCMTAHCRTDADCTAKPGGRCAPISDPCGCSAVQGSKLGLACVFPGGCQDSSDCGFSVMPGTSVTPSHCELDQIAGTGVCKAGFANCPD